MDTYENARPKYKRVLLKISGEALDGGKQFGIDFDVVRSVCEVIKECNAAGVEIGVVVGGGNFWRGMKDGAGKMERTRADHMGMMATVMNSLAVADVLEQLGVQVRVVHIIQHHFHGILLLPTLQLLNISKYLVYLVNR